MIRRLGLSVGAAFILCVFGAVAIAGALDAKIDAQWSHGPNGILVRGTTNLPNGARLSVSLIGGPGASLNGVLVAGTQIDRTNVTVRAGAFQTDQPLALGRHLQAGKYRLRIFCSPLLQPANVEKVLGHDGRNISGELAHQDGSQRNIVYVADVELP